MCLVFPRPLGPEELPETPGQALCASGPPLRSRPPRPWRPRSLGGGVPEAVGKGRLVAGGSWGVPGVGTAWCSLSHLALWSLLRPRAKASAPPDPLCPRGLIHPPGQALCHLEAPSTLWGLLALSALLLPPEPCPLGPPSPLPFCPLDWALQPPGCSSALQFPPPSRATSAL